MAIRIQLRRDTAANWTSANPVLLAGELGIETDTLKIKIGNGNNWNDITSYANTTPSSLTSTLNDYVLAADLGQPSGVATLDSTGKIPVTQLGNLIDSAPGVLDTLNEIAAAINDDANFATTMTTLINNTGTNAALDATTKSNNAVTTAGAYTDGQITSLHTAVTSETGLALTNHSNDTTGIHGIADTALLATKAYADSAATTSALAAQSSAETTAATALSSHEADTTNVHGIASTADLATKAYADNAANTVQSNVNTSLLDYATKAGAMFTGNISAPLLTATDVAVTSTLTANDVTIDGDLVVNGTTTSVNTLNINLRDNIIYLNEAVDKLVTNAVGNGTSVTYTVDNSDGSFVAGNVARVTGITPSALDCGWLTIQSATTTSFTVTKTDTDTYTSGGTAYTKADINPDLGFAGGYNDGSYAHGGLVRDASDNGIWKLFSGVTTEPGASVDFSSYTRAPLQVGALFATGALIGDVTNTELQYVHGVTSAIQTQMDLKAPLADATFTGTIVLPSTTSIGDASSTEIGYLNGVTGLIQSQLDAKAPLSSPTFTGTVTVSSSGIEFTDGAQTKQGVPSLTQIIDKTADYTLSSLSERDSMIQVDSSSPVTITIPPNADVAFPIGASLDVIGINTGLITIAGGSGVTVNATPGLKLRAQWSSATLFKRGTNNWVVYGDLKA